MKRLFGKIMFAALVMGMMVLLAVPVAAQSPLIRVGYLSTKSKTLRNYDITGDGKADKLSIGLGNPTEEGTFKKLILRLEGKAIFTKQYKDEGTFGVTVKILTMKDKSVYIYLSDALLNDYVSLCGLFKYNGTKLVRVFDFITFNGQYKTSVNHSLFTYQKGEPYAVDGNRILVNVHFQCAALAQVAMRTYLVHKDGRPRLSTRYLHVVTIGGKPASNYFKLVGKLKGYARSTGTLAGATFEANEELHVPELYVGKGILRFIVVNRDGEYAFLDAHKYFTSSGKKFPIFRGLSYSG